MDLSHEKTNHLQAANHRETATLDRSLQLGWVGPRNGCWDWISSHFSHLQSVSPQDAIDWSTNQEDSLLLIAVDGRNSDELELVDAMANTSRISSAPSAITAESKSMRGRKRAGASKAKSENQPTSDTSLRTNGWLALLGEEWAGHRRTFPLPDDVPAFYWYELYDRVLPFIAHRSLDSSVWNLFQPIDGHSRSLRADRWTQWVQTLNVSSAEAALQVLIVADSSTDAELWLDLFSSNGLHTICVGSESWNVGCRPDFVLVDLLPQPRLGDTTRHTRRVEDVVKRAAYRFGNAPLFVVDQFPRWDDWHRWLQCGAHAIFPKPTAIDGLRWCFRQWNPTA